MKFIKNHILIVLITILAASCSKNESGSKYLYISEDSYSFSYDGTDSLVITVMSSSEWEADASANDWIKAVKTDKNTLVVKADKNETSEIRTGKIIIKSGENKREFNAEQFPKTFEGRMQDFFGSITEASISRNGKYAAAMTVVYEDPNSTIGTGIPHVIDLETGDTVKINFPKSKDHNFIAAVSDDGRTVIYENIIDVKCDLVINGEFTELNLPSGYVSAKPQGMSADGSIIVGYATNTKDGRFYPVKWTNNEPEILEMPDVDEFGKPNANGTIVRGCSADGNVIYGSEWNTMAAVYWVDNQMHYLASSFINSNDISSVSGNEISGYISRLADMNAVSHNGKYFVGSFIAEGAESMYGGFPAVIDTESGKITVFDNIGGNSVMIDNEGNMVVAVPSMSPTSCLFVNINTPNESISAQDYIKNKFGITIPENKIIKNISEDGKTFGGMSAFPVTPPYVDYVAFYISFINMK